jgi:hypothetical protein
LDSQVWTLGRGNARGRRLVILERMKSEGIVVVEFINKIGLKHKGLGSPSEVTFLNFEAMGQSIHE